MLRLDASATGDESSQSKTAGQTVEAGAAPAKQDLTGSREEKQTQSGTLSAASTASDTKNTSSAAEGSNGRSLVSQSDGNTGVAEDLSLLFRGLSLFKQFNASKNMKDLHDGISTIQSGLTKISSTSPNYTIGLSNLASALMTRFGLLDDPEDLDRAIILHRHVLELRPSPHPARSTTLSILAAALSARSNRRGDSQDLDESILLRRQVLGLKPLPHPDRPMALKDIADALHTRFERQGNIQDLEDSISFQKAALAIGLPARLNFELINNLAIALRTRFEHQGNFQDLDESISFHRQALMLYPSSLQDRALMLNNLANALHIRFDHQGDIVDLNECIAFHRQALELRAAPNPNRSISLNNLASALKVRFEQQNHDEDIDEAILLHRQALELLTLSDPHRSASLTNLASALKTRFEYRGAIRDVDESISLHRDALQLLHPTHPNRSISLTNLAIALWSRSVSQGGAQDLDECISLHRQALVLRPSPHPNRSSSLSNLANALRNRFNQRSDPQDFDESISLHTESVDLFPCSHPRRYSAINNLAIVLSLAYKRRGDSAHLERAMRLFSESATPPSQSPSARFRNAVKWAYHADLFEHPSAIEAYDIVLHILPELAALSLDIKSRQDSLTKGTDGLSRKAARCAIRNGSLDKAVEFLETGRSVFWSQYLSLRSPFDTLHGVAPQLATNLRRISRELEAGSHRPKPADNLDNRQKLTWEQENQRLDQLAKEWKDKIDEVRALEGFDDFLQPLRLSKLQTAAGGGPIIYLIANEDSSDCLILTSTSVRHMPLPKFSTSLLSRLVELVQIAATEYQASPALIKGIVDNSADLPRLVDDDVVRTLGSFLDGDTGRGMRPERHIFGRLSSDDILRRVLKILWDDAVQPVINHLGFKKSSTPPAVTWCATGLFTFLPIHAAGLYDDALVDCASDYIISSYIPTAGAHFIPTPTSHEHFKMLAVIQPKALPYTKKELEKIEKHVGVDYLVKFGAQDAPASVEAVASQLSTASIVHFACHGKQSSTEPLESCLEIENDRLTISRIMKESTPRGSLAFLSACETAAGDQTNPDEALNLGASLLFTGFRSVVATMWRIWDEDGPIIADRFYGELCEGPGGKSMPHPDTSKSAAALSLAVQELRASGVPFKRWVSFIHMGR